MSFTARSPGTKHILLAGQSIHKTNNNHLFVLQKIIIMISILKNKVQFNVNKYKQQTQFYTRLCIGIIMLSPKAKVAK